MLIDAITVGSLVNLEVVIGNIRFDINSKVAGVSSGAILIETLRTSKQLAKFDAKEISSAIYNLYADDYDGNRVVWNNVQVRPIEYNGHSYSAIQAKSFKQESLPSDRRVNDRIKLDSMPARVETKDGEVFDVTLYDVSGNGVSFFSDKDLLNKRLIVHIEEKVEETEYKLSVSCTCVRKVDAENEDDMARFGCDVREADRHFLDYIFDKKLAMRRLEVY